MASNIEIDQQKLIVEENLNPPSYQDSTTLGIIYSFFGRKCQKIFIYL
jgi:hypothetical protein